VLNFGNFWGRSSKKEFWGTVAVVVAIYGVAVLEYLTIPVSTGEIVSDNLRMLLTIAVYYCFGMSSFMMFSLTIRRLHDIGKSGWNILFLLIPGLNVVMLLNWSLTDGDKGPNKFGETSLDVEAFGHTATAKGH
jgi:uncharacterized membrane protein YhaH (DUF805 family)